MFIGFLVRGKFNIGEHTRDDVFIDAERRFQQLEKGMLRGDVCLHFCAKVLPRNQEAGR